MVGRPPRSTLFPYPTLSRSLLSPEAGAEPIPVLEIKANDILRCGHGATAGAIDPTQLFYAQARGDRKSTRLNSSHANISYAVFCLKKKKTKHMRDPITPTTL